MMLPRFLRRAALAAAAILFSQLPGAADAQNFDRPVRIIVPFAPGGTSDILARLISPKLSAAIGQSVVVENKPGAAGNLGADSVAKATADGHTLLLMDVGSLATAPSLFSNLTYNVEKDLAPISMVMFGPYVLAVHESIPAKTTAELIAYAKANPGKLAVANSGVGAANHITAVIMAKELGIQLKNVPYKGGAAATRAVISGESGAIINGAAATLPFVTNKQLVGLAVTGEERIASAPELPTFKEAKLPGGDAGKILETPEIKAKIAEQGGVVRAGGPEGLSTWLKEATIRWGDAIRDAGIKGE
jgi:tripartite-type tricarboxylate transporter receptor subunit TctC